MGIPQGSRLPVFQQLLCQPVLFRHFLDGFQRWQQLLCKKHSLWNPFTLYKWGPFSIQAFPEMVCGCEYMKDPVAALLDNECQVHGHKIWLMVQETHDQCQSIDSHSEGSNKSLGKMSPCGHEAWVVAHIDPHSLLQHPLLIMSIMCPTFASSIHYSSATGSDSRMCCSKYGLSQGIRPAWAFLRFIHILNFYSVPCKNNEI